MFSQSLSDLLYLRETSALSALGRSLCPCIAIRWDRTSRCCFQVGKTADFSNPLDQTKTSAAVACGTWRTLANCYERRGCLSISDPGAPQRTNTNLFSEIVGKYPITYPITRSRTSTSACKRPSLSHLDAMRSSIHWTTSRSFQTMVRGPRWICLGKVPSAIWA